MKQLIDRYTFHLVKRNLIYFVSFFIFILLAIFILPIQIRDFLLFKEKNHTLIGEVADLERKRIVISSFDTDEIERLLLTLNTLLPQKEDYFSIFPALDNLSQLTGVVITGFTLPFSQTQQTEKLALTVGIEGAPESLVNFLENYHYRGGRLVTVDQISYSPSASQLSLVLNFHAKETKVQEVDAVPNIDKARLNLIKRINQELGGIFTSPTDEPINPDYSVRDNPFGVL